MTWGELKNAFVDVPDSMEIHIVVRPEDFPGTVPGLYPFKVIKPGEPMVGPDGPALFEPINTGSN